MTGERRGGGERGARRGDFGKIDYNFLFNVLWELKLNEGLQLSSYAFGRNGRLNVNLR